MDRQIIIDGDIARVPLTQNRWVIIDKRDVGVAGGVLWSCDGNYAHRSARMPDGRCMKVYLHRLIMCPPDGYVVDHINGDTLDNRRENLRVCTLRENLLNKRTHSRNTSGFKGVDFHKKLGKWRARICKFGKRVNIGLYNTAEDAARAYDRVAKEYMGEYARLNFSQN